MNACPACQKAITEDARHAEFRAGCKSCEARALACTGAHLSSKAAGKMTTKYLEVLKAMFGDEWEAGAAEVKRWDGIQHGSMK